jgi:hypothetical protein
MTELTDQDGVVLMSVGNESKQARIEDEEIEVIVRVCEKGKVYESSEVFTTEWLNQYGPHRVVRIRSGVLYDNILKQISKEKRQS